MKAALVSFLQLALAIVGVIALGIVGAGYFLPSAFDVRRSTLIEAPPDKVYDLIADPRNWARWSAWNRRDPKMDVDYSGPPFGKGAKWSWKSESQGSGKMEFTHVVPDRRVEFALTLNDFRLVSTGAFNLEPAPKGTKVTWSNSGDVGGNPLKHYIAYYMDRLVGPDFEEGLANLKAVAEKPA